MTNIIVPALIIAAIGCVAGIILTIAYKIMQVPVDETVAAIRGALPGANCGACGYAGCDDYAKALADNHDLSTALCPVGGAQAAMWIAGILGKTADSSTPKVAVVLCSGNSATTYDIMNLSRLKSCRAAKTIFGGQRSCQHGCLGRGDCENVCDYNAVHVVNGLAVVDRSRCVGCGKCKFVCPNHVIDIREMTDTVYVSCRSVAKGAVTKQICSSGCLGCQRCKKACPHDAIIIENNLARIDYEKCEHCGACVEVCPADSIISHEKKVKARPKGDHDGSIKM